jgi:hypothetical protein
MVHDLHKGKYDALVSFCCFPTHIDGAGKAPADAFD